MDCLRADKISKNYNNKNLTPNIDKLLNNSLYFQNCIASSPWTLPSHASMFTGLYPSEHQMIDPLSEPLNDLIPTIAEILSNKDYQTICYTENVYISKLFGLDRGFDHYFSDLKTEKKGEVKKISNIFNLFLKKSENVNRFIIFIADIIKRIYGFYKKFLEIVSDFSIYNTGLYCNSIKNLDLVWKQLDNNNNRPYYIFFNIMATHAPYLAPKKILEYFNIKKSDFSQVKSFFNNIKGMGDKVNFNQIELNESIKISLEKFYNATVFYADFIIKEILNNLRKKNLLDNSILIITSDHGEHLGDHDLWQHMTEVSLYENVIRVPLIIYNYLSEKGKIENQIELKDIFHTILHMTGLFNKSNNYLNLKKSLIYQIKNNRFPKYIYGEYLKSKNKKLIIKKYRKKINSQLIPLIISNIRFFRSNRYKFIEYSNKDAKDEFYNILNDKKEEINIINEFKDKPQEFKEYMTEKMEQIKGSKRLVDLKTQKSKDKIREIIKSKNLKF